LLRDERTTSKVACKGGERQVAGSEGRSPKSLIVVVALPVSAERNSSSTRRREEEKPGGERGSHAERVCMVGGFFLFSFVPAPPPLLPSTPVAG
jgi:hypothetical protein